ncbi:unnamed protein product, partial [Tetraodon nigroviridis]
MLKKKSSNTEKKRKRSQPNERHDGNKRRSAETQVERAPTDDLSDPELDRIGSDIEDGGLDLSLPFKPIGAYVEDKREMLDQCFHVLGEKKLRKMLPEELKGCTLEEIKKLCWDQLESITEKNLTRILAGEDATSAEAEEPAAEQQDKNVDSTSKQETGASGEESDVLSINADSDIDGPKEEPAPEQPSPEPSAGARRAEAKRDIQSAIDQSVSQILTLASASSKGGKEEPGSDACSPSPTHTPATGPPSVQQLELLELEMRARAIKALMKANSGKKP